MQLTQPGLKLVSIKRHSLYQHNARLRASNVQTVGSTVRFAPDLQYSAIFQATATTTIRTMSHPCLATVLLGWREELWPIQVFIGFFFLPPAGY